MTEVQTVQPTDSAAVLSLRSLLEATHTESFTNYYNVVEVSSPDLLSMADEVGNAILIERGDESFAGPSLLSYFEFGTQSDAAAFLGRLGQLLQDVGHDPVLGPTVFPIHNGDKEGPCVVALNFSTRSVGNKITIADFLTVAEVNRLYDLISDNSPF